MTVGTMAAVFQRIDAIETRFGRTRQPSIVAQPTTGRSGQDFDAMLDLSTDAAREGHEHAGGPPITSAPSTDAMRSLETMPAPTVDWGQLYGGTSAASLLTDLDRRAALGQLLGPTTSPLSTDLDRLAAIGALPAGSTPGVSTMPATTSSIVTVGGTTVGTVGAPAPATTTAPGQVATNTPFAAEFERAGALHGVPPRLLAAVGWVESRYQTDAVSPDGAIGLMQIMPMTANELGVNPHDPIDAIDGAARLLAMHERRFGSWDLALAAYHSGAGAVSRNGNQPPPRAATYVARVHDRLETS